jgi:hypothetical protein
MQLVINRLPRARFFTQVKQAAMQEVRVSPLNVMHACRQDALAMHCERGLVRVTRCSYVISGRFKIS